MIGEVTFYKVVNNKYYRITRVATLVALAHGHPKVHCFVLSFLLYKNDLPSKSILQNYGLC